MKVIATSREGLRVAAEHFWPVPSLDVRGGATSAAVESFIERARAVKPGKRYRGENVMVLLGATVGLIGTPTS